ncbi:toxin CSTX-20-like [Centruroides vittatus]|uniref:toxin CSTX-20-like n=1 Tax=Centruroides vittatus TaxID=120091 RepID=UPI0035109A7B
MKYFLILLLAVIAVKLSFGCNSQEDCADDECCLDPLFSKRTYCSKRKKLGAYCLTSEESLHGVDGKQVYLIDCPCQKGLDCIHTEEETEHKRKLCMRA